MEFDVADLIRRTGKTRRPRIVLAAIEPTSAQETDLLAIYRKVVSGWLAQWRDNIEPAYTRTLGEAVTDSVDDVEGETDAAAAAMSRLVLTLDAELEDWTVRVEQWHRGRFAQLFTPAGVKLDTLLGRGDVRSTLQATLAQNVSLIRSLDDQMRNGISGAVFRGLTNRTPARDVARDIRKVTDVGKRRAELIAADQLQKLTARLDQERQEQVGLSKFQWAHSRKKYPRPEHVARDGKVYAWSSSVGRTDPPGRAIRCGCRARPVVELEPTAVEQDPAPAPAAAPRSPKRVTNAARDRAARDHVLTNGRRENVEFLSGYDARTGRQLGVNRGLYDQCAFTPEMEKAVRDEAARVVLHHNHPRSTSLSEPDIRLLNSPGLRTVWAHAHNGSSFSASRGKLPLPPKRVFEATQGAVHTKLQALLTARLIDVDAAILLDNHVAWLAMHARGQLNYVFDLQGESLAAWKKYAALLSSVLESLT